MKLIRGEIMINQLDQVMLYVYDQEAAKNFWIEKLNFVEVSDVSNQSHTYDCT